MVSNLHRLLTLLVVAQSPRIIPASATPTDNSLSEGIPHVAAILSTERINPHNPPFLVECTCTCVTNEQLSHGRFAFCDCGGLATDGKSCDQAFAGQKDFCWKLGLPPKKSGALSLQVHVPRRSCLSHFPTQSPSDSPYGFTIASTAPTATSKGNTTHSLRARFCL